MKIIYFVVAFIFGVLSWICHEVPWQYSHILFYICLFITSWYINLVFLYQEENEVSKKYSVLTPSNLIYLIIISVILFLLRDYNIKKYETVTYSFYKIVAIVNAIQAAFIVIFYKFRDIFYHV